MPEVMLRQKLRAMCESKCTLLWLEGAQQTRVLSVRLAGSRLVLRLANNTSRVVAFEKFVVTSVGMQFWSQGRPGVLYRWDQVPANSWSINETAFDHNDASPDEPPPDIAA